MNRWIAKWFGRVLAVIHTLFFIAVIFGGFAWLQENMDALRSGIINPSYVLLIAFTIFISYILIMGVMSTFVSINSYLAEIVERQNGGNASSPWVASTAPAERIEPEI